MEIFNHDKWYIYLFVKNPWYWVSICCMTRWVGQSIYWAGHSFASEINLWWNINLSDGSHTIFTLTTYCWDSSSVDVLFRGSTMFRSGISWFNNAKTGLFCEGSFSCPSKINRISVVNSWYTTTNTLLNPFQQRQNKVITFY